MNHLRLALVLLVATAALHAPASAWSQADVEAAPVASPPAPLLSKVRLMGASLTAGFGNASELETGRNIPLTTFFQACLADKNKDAELSETGSNTFFLAPQVTGAQQTARARAAEPTLVIALDFLFWYAAGVNSRDKPRRMKGLEMGLKELEGFTCPLVIGTIPDVRHALQGKGPFGGPMIHRSQVPSDEQRLAMNQRILEWVADRKNVKVVDLEGLFRSIVHAEPVEIRGQTWTIEGLESVLQRDLLHPNLAGTILTAIAVVDKVAELDGASEEDFVFDASQVRERFLGLIEPIRMKQAERKAGIARRKAARGK